MTARVAGPDGPDANATADRTPDDAVAGTGVPENAVPVEVAPAYTAVADVPDTAATGPAPTKDTVDTTPPVADGGAEPASLSELGFDAIDGWVDDDHAAALSAFLHSCTWFDDRPDDQEMAYPDGIGRVADWRAACRAARTVPADDGVAARLFFETHFRPVTVADGGLGLFTGYFAPLLHGSFEPSDTYSVPLYRRPARRPGERLPTRAEIVDGALADRDLELVWVDDAIDAFFLEIQGSGLVEFEDGTISGVGYHGNNGHSYYAIGRELIDREIATREEMSMALIRDWLRDNPDEAQDVMNLNESFIFFELRDPESIRGYLEVPLTPGRSLAVDWDHIPRGVPLWLEIADDPTIPGGSMRRLVVAQDTGGAIRGAVAGDLFWGYGDKAGHIAGGMQARGRYTMLIPRETLSIAAR